MAWQFDVKDFGGIGDGTTDDTAAIKNAIAAAKANGGGIVFFPPGTYAITSTLLIQADHVKLLGVGGGVDPQVLHGPSVNPTTSANAMIASAPTRILWRGAVGGVMVKLDVEQVGGAWVSHMGCGLEDLVLDGAGVAATCFLSLSHNRIRMRGVTVARYLNYGYSLGVTDNQNVRDWSSALNHFEDCLATNFGQPFCGNDRGLILWGDAFRGNVNYTQFFNCQFVTNPGYPANYMNVSIEQADNCNFYGCSWNAWLHLHADDTGDLSTGFAWPEGGFPTPSLHPSCAIVHTFYGCGGPIIARGSSQVGGNSSNQNVAYGYRLGNGVLYPVIEPGADLTVYCNSALRADGNLVLGFHTTGPGGINYGSGLAGVTLFGSTQSVPHNRLRVVTWQNTFYDPMNASSGGQVIVPPGVKWVRATAQIVWAISNAGWRYAEIGSSGGTQCRQWTPTTVSDGATMLQSHWFPVKEGWTIGLNVKQGSGGALSLSSTSFLQVEFK